jgi:hypothetical protein
VLILATPGMKSRRIRSPLAAAGPGIRVWRMGRWLGDQLAVIRLGGSSLAARPSVTGRSWSPASQVPAAQGDGTLALTGRGRGGAWRKADQWQANGATT